MYYTELPLSSQESVEIFFLVDLLTQDNHAGACCAWDGATCARP